MALGNKEDKKPDYRAYNMAVDLYNQSGRITVVDECFAFMFTNVGDTYAEVNGMRIFPSATPLISLGDSRSISGHLMDLFKGTIVLSFTPGGANPLVEIVQMFYVSSYKSNK